MARTISFIERLYPWIYGNEHFVTESRTSESDLKWLGVRGENIIRIPPGVDLELFHPGEKVKHPQLIYFGGFRAHKGPMYAIDCLRIPSR
ncbi:hypothetical protein GCM10007108_13460 [Thermogymnomonas acidicola]|uniref:Uncharacterized protein n=1 Tax=Thermogymnomonas acidicola TaxID=399579 RepID=A0AA37F9W3_9ARCH|nr:hypothetical protein GCM10007108_13460 [Thermogymnomonas acidicola]